MPGHLVNLPGVHEHCDPSLVINGFENYTRHGKVSMQSAGSGLARFSQLFSRCESLLVQFRNSGLACIFDLLDLCHLSSAILHRLFSTLQLLYST